MGYPEADKQQRGNSLNTQILAETRNKSKYNHNTQQLQSTATPPVNYSCDTLKRRGPGEERTRN